MKKQIIVTAYVNPDLDGFASAVAYAEYLQKTGKDAAAGIIGGPDIETKYILKRFNFDEPKYLNDTDDYDKIILTDASELNGLLGKVDPVKVMEVIDHRRINQADKFPNAKFQIEFVGAAATLIAEKFMRNKIIISKSSAILLYGAIISNTLNFKAGVTTDRDRTAEKWLNTRAKLPTDFWKDLFRAKSDLSCSKLAERIENDFARFEIGGNQVGIAQIEIIGVKKLLDERLNEIISTLDKIKREKNLDIIFQNTIELDEMKNYIIATDPETQNLLTRALTIKFTGSVAIRSELIMRKQIVPLLKEELE